MSTHYHCPSSWSEGFMFPVPTVKEYLSLYPRIILSMVRWRAKQELSSTRNVSLSSQVHSGIRGHSTEWEGQSRIFCAIYFFLNATVCEYLKKHVGWDFITYISQIQHGSAAWGVEKECRRKGQDDRFLLACHTSV